MVDLSAWSSLGVPAAGAILAYGYNRRHAVLQQRASLYTDALAALDKLQQAPYRIRRRTTDDQQQRQALADLVQDVQEDLSHFEFLLRLDSPRVSRAFTRLLMDARELAVAERTKAWLQSPLNDPAQMEVRYWINFDNQFLWHACITEMRRELRMLPGLRSPMDPREVIDAERQANRFVGGDGTTYTLSTHSERQQHMLRPRLRDRPPPKAWVRVTWLGDEDRLSWESLRYPSMTDAQNAAQEVRAVLEQFGQVGLPSPHQ